MKYKMMFVSIVSLVSMGAIAQSKNPVVFKTTFGITGGINWNNINGKMASGAELNDKLKTGFEAGVNVEIPFSSGFYFQPGVEYRQKGSEFANGDRLSLAYVEVPVNLVYKPALGNGSVLLGFGPYLGFGVDGDVTSVNGTVRNVKL